MPEPDAVPRDPAARPGVHVTLPAYGDDPFLREAVASVLEQDCSAWRLTVLDDGPDDLALAAWFRSLDDPRVEYRRNDPRLGINRNFQLCLETAELPWVVLLGADDRLLPGYVRAVSDAAIDHSDAAWIQPRVRVIDVSGKASNPPADRVKSRLAPRMDERTVLVTGGEALVRSLLVGNWMYFPAVAFRTEQVLRYGFVPGDDVVLDLDLYLRMLVDGATAVYLGATEFEYRRHAASLSSAAALTGDRFEEERSFYERAAQASDTIGWPRAARAARLRVTSRLHAALSITQVRDAAAARALLRHALGR